MNTALKIVQQKEDVLVVNSMAVAEIFGKRHADVLRKVDQQVCQYPEAFRQRNFALTSAQVEMPTGGYREERAYDLTKDGFMAVAMTFTGQKAAMFRVMVIEEFNRMSELLHPQSGDNKLTGAIVALLESNSRLMATVVEKAKYHDRAIEELQMLVSGLIAPDPAALEPLTREHLDDAIDARVKELGLPYSFGRAAIRGAIKRRFKVNKYFNAPVGEAFIYAQDWKLGMYGTEGVV